jgi:hypothetical protein
VLTSTRPVTAGAWTITNTLANAGATPALTIAVTAGTFTITWTSTTLRDLLGFARRTAITAQTSATGTVCRRGVWQPDCPLTTMKRHRSAPLKTDMRQSRTPTGIVYANIGNERYQHDDVRWSHVPTNKVWRVDETVTNESLQQWLDDTQLGRGHAWFSVGSKCKLIAHDGNLVGGSFDSVEQLVAHGLHRHQRHRDGPGDGGLGRALVGVGSRPSRATTADVIRPSGPSASPLSTRGRRPPEISAARSVGLVKDQHSERHSLPRHLARRHKPDGNGPRHVG